MFTKEPVDFEMESWEVETITFECNATTDPSVSLKYTWKHNDVGVDAKRPE